MTAGENIRKRRLDLGLSQQDLANALGFKTRSSIAKIEKNASKLSHEKLLTLSNVLNTTADYLLTGKESDNETSFRGNVFYGSEINEIPSPNGKKKRCAAIILAGGRYRVNKYKIPYQFVCVKEKPIIIYTMEAYQRHPLVDEIYVVCLEGWEDFLPAYAEKYNITKFKGIIPAGEKGIQSVKNAVEWLSSSYSASDIFILQESTRPLVDSETISNAIHCCKQFGSAVTFTRLEDTNPFLLDRDGKSVIPVDAYNLITLQSPEVYSLGLLKYAFIEAAKIKHPLTETICAVFMHNLGREITFCEGNHNNMRIVYDEDIRLLEALI